MLGKQKPTETSRKRFTNNLQAGIGSEYRSRGLRNPDHHFYPTSAWRIKSCKSGRGHNGVIDGVSNWGIVEQSRYKACPVWGPLLFSQSKQLCWFELNLFRDILQSLRELHHGNGQRMASLERTDFHVAVTNMVKWSINVEERAPRLWKITTEQTAVHACLSDWIAPQCSLVCRTSFWNDTVYHSKCTTRSITLGDLFFGEAILLLFNRREGGLSSWVAVDLYKVLQGM